MQGHADVDASLPELRFSSVQRGQRSSVSGLAIWVCLQHGLPSPCGEFHKPSSWLAAGPCTASFDHLAFVRMLSVPRIKAASVCENPASVSRDPTTAAASAGACSLSLQSCICLGSQCPVYCPAT